MSLLNAMRTKNSLTHNGAVTNSTSLNFCLDMFFLAGASRTMSEEDIILLFERAFGQSPLTAIRVLFWARDARGGAGEKRFFQIILSHIQKTYPDVFTKIYPLVYEYGYFKDLFKMRPTQELLNYFAWALSHHSQRNLLAKYFPRKGKWFNAFRIHQEEKPKTLRKFLVEMTKVVETQMCNNEWDAIEYSKVPSVAMRTYAKSFGKHDHPRFSQYITDVLKGDKKINASVLFPNQLYRAYLMDESEDQVQAQWNALPDYLTKSENHRILPICDVSGSMEGLPMEVSVSLGVYISEKNRGIFKDAFVTFSSKPKIQILKGDLYQRFRQLDNAEWGMNTDLNAVFSLILNSAVRENLPENEMPTSLLIISDMEFDSCGHLSNLDSLREMYSRAGYKLPSVVFWNVNGRLNNIPATINDKGVALVSGFSPSILMSVLDGTVTDPVSMMLKVINSPRYEQVEL